MVRLVIDSLPEDSVDKKVSTCYMQNFSDWDIRIELRITKKSLLESRKRIKEKLLCEAERLEDHGLLWYV